MENIVFSGKIRFIINEVRCFAFRRKISEKQCRETADRCRFPAFAVGMDLAADLPAQCVFGIYIPFYQYFDIGHRFTAV